jgi:hypothetical protein
MPSIKKRDVSENNNANDEFNPVEFLKSLSVDNFLSCKETKDILIAEHFWKFEKELKPILVDLYCEYNSQFIDSNCLFGKDPNMLYADYFAELIYEHIDKEYDLSIFYYNPELAEPLFELYNK